MITELTPETYFPTVEIPNRLSVVMHYGATCGPCKGTMPHYEAVADHFNQYAIHKVQFFRFHHWEKDYKQFIEDRNLHTPGVPTFKFFFLGETVEEITRPFNNPDVIKKVILTVVEAVDKTMGGFKLYDE